MQRYPSAALIACLLLGLSAGITHSAEAQTAQGGSKATGKMPTTARIKSMEAGDRACYVELEDKRGNKYEDLADFEVCEKTNFIGKWVVITRKKASIMSAACAGRDDCTLSETVHVIVGIEAVR